MTKYLYIVEHLVPIPQSEYGGLQNVVAEHDDECFGLIVNSDDGLNQPHYSRLRGNIMKALTYALAEDLDSCIVEEFTT